MNRHFTLVYQCGIANVFDISSASGDPIRLMQSGFRDCEMFLRGAAHAGVRTEIRHCDQAGDVAGSQWEPGAGELFVENKALA